MKNYTFVHSLFFVVLLMCAACQPKQDPAMVTVRATGDIRVFGKSVADLETLKTMLVDSLAAMNVIPEKLTIHFEGEVGMGMRQEIESIGLEAIEKAKLMQNAPVVEIQSYRKEQGDCLQPDSLRTNCAMIDMQYPLVMKGAKVLQDSVTNWTLRYLASVLEGGSEQKAKTPTLDEAAVIFFNNHEEYKGSAMGGAFEARTGSEVVYNDGKYLTLAINGYSYQGGAHGSPTQALNTFDVNSGKRLTWDELVTDKAAVQAIAEKKVREIKAEVFKEGFDFDDIFPFTLPVCYGLTKEGLFLYYVPYEIMPYAYGDTEVLIPFEELGDLSKIRL